MADWMKVHTWWVPMEEEASSEDISVWNLRVTRPKINGFELTAK